MQDLAIRILNMHRTLGQWAVRKHKGRLLQSEQVSRALLSNDPNEVQEQLHATVILLKAVVTKSKFYSEFAQELLQQVDNLQDTRNSIEAQQRLNAASEEQPKHEEE